MSLDPLFPFAGNHAIQNLSCGLEWSDRLAERDFKAMRDRIQQRLQVFRHFQQHQALTVNVSEGATPVVANTAGSGFTCSTNPPIGEAPRRSMNFTPEQVAIAINEYSGWTAVKKDIDSYVREIMDVVGGTGRGLTGIGFQYSDVFHWKADPSTMRLEEIFRADTPYLSPVIFGAKSYWHCNQGFFEAGALQNSRNLVNVNVQRAETPGTGVDLLQIITVHKLLFDKPQFISPDDKFRAVSDVYERFHADNKALLKSLLTPAVCEKIKLV